MSFVTKFNAWRDKQCYTLHKEPEERLMEIYKDEMTGKDNREFNEWLDEQPDALIKEPESFLRELFNDEKSEGVAADSPIRVRDYWHLKEDDRSVSDGSTAEYYSFKDIGATEIQHLISHKDMNAQIGEIFRTCYRYGEASHSSRIREAKKIKFYIDAEIARLEK